MPILLTFPPPVGHFLHAFQLHDLPRSRLGHQYSIQHAVCTQQGLCLASIPSPHLGSKRSIHCRTSACLRSVHQTDLLSSSKFHRTFTSIPWAPFQLHSIVMAIFASLVAPFGGFFASGFKRAFNIKDFGDSIPGHGGMTDRMDCQFLMGLFSYVCVCSTSVSGVL